MRQLPSGTVTFLFSDIEGSTKLLDELGPDAYAAELAEHRRKMRDAFTAQGGVEVDTQGDAFFIAFPTASGALAAARDAQAALARGPIRVRMGIHSGEPLVTEEGYVGIDVHRGARVMSAGHGGQVVVSAETHALLDGTTALVELGRHRLKDLTEPQPLYQLGEEQFPPLKTLYQSNLPVQPTPLVGREAELAEVLQHLEQSRLVTLTGAGGSGKTRLALQAAAELVDDYKDGVWWVPLAALRDPELVEPTIAQVVGAKDGLAEHLAGKQTLLLLDNFEQVVDAAPTIAELLAAAPSVCALATSRQRLNLAAEQEYAVPLMVPLEAVALFTARARQLRPEFVPGEEVAEICRRLDGLPLALELAAARVKALTPEQILDHLGRSLELLTGGTRDAPRRQQTLQATIDWSHELLDEAEAGLFARLAVFAGSFDLEAAQAICDASLASLEGLVDKSLVRPTDEGRFFMLETIREYAGEKLDREGAAAEGTRLRHARYFTELAERNEPELRTSATAAALMVFEREQSNLRLAIETAKRAGDVDLEGRACAACWYFWALRSNIQEGLERLGAALDDSQRAAIQASLHEGLTVLASQAGDAVAAYAHAEEALALRRGEGEPAALLRALLNRGGAAEGAGDAEAARPYYEECVAMARLVGDRWFAGVALANLSSIHLIEEEFDRSAELGREAVALNRELGDPGTVAACEANLGFAELGLGRLEAASALFRSALLAAADKGIPEPQVWCLVGIGALIVEKMPIAAATLVRSVDAWCAEVGYELGAHEQRLRDRVAELAGGPGGVPAVTLAEAVSVALECTN